MLIKSVYRFAAAGGNAWKLYHKLNQILVSNRHVYTALQACMCFAALQGNAEAVNDCKHHVSDTPELLWLMLTETLVLAGCI